MLESENKIDRNLRVTLKLYEDLMHKYANPSDIPAQTILDYSIQKVRVEHTSVMLSPEEQLEALDLFEKWYIENNVKTANPSWLERQKKYWLENIE